MNKNAKLCVNLIKETFTKEYSEIYDICYGIHISQITSIDGTKLYASKPEYFRILDLAITSTTLSDCLSNYLEGEILQNDNQWYNEKLDTKMDVCKKLIFWKLPKVLVIALKRFDNISNKNQTLVHFPLEDLQINSSETEMSYDLFAIVNHYGVMLGGHYTAYLKNPNGKWYKYNDTIVNEIAPDRLITSRAYCLFYRKKE